jgi:Cu+-exporting ATPase
MATVTDPVCGMQFDSRQAAAQAVHDGVAYYFCSEECRDTFLEDPEQFVEAGDR